MKKNLFLILSIALTQCNPKNPNEAISCNPPKDTAVVDTITPPVDTVVVNPLDTLPLITHGDEIGIVEPVTGPLVPFKAEPIDRTRLAAPEFMLIQGYPTTRTIYLDRAHLVYKNATESAKFAKYCKDWKFTRVKIYHFGDMVASSANFPYIHTFFKLLRANGVKKIVAVLGSGSTSGFERLWASTSDTTKKPNGIDLELEYWNGATSYSNWINTLATLDGYCDSKNPDLTNSFYIGWPYKNTGGLTGYQVALQQQQEVDVIDMHIYQDGKVSATYGAVRWEDNAKAAQTRGKIQVMNPLISTEEIDWGAESNFQGYYLQALGYAGIEKKFIDDWNLKASPLQKQWIKIGEFAYFMKRYNYMAIPPMP